MASGLLRRIALGLAMGAALCALRGHCSKCTGGHCPLTAHPLRGAVFGAVIGLLLSVTSRSGPPIQPRPEDSAVLAIDGQAAFQRQVREADQPVMVDFYSDGCPPCRALAPLVEELAEEYRGRARVCKVNLDRQSSMARPFEIQGIPAVLFFRDGREVQRLVGLRQKEEYTAVLEDLLAETQAGG